MEKFFEGLSKIIDVIKDTYPKKSIQLMYVEIVKLAVDFASAEVEDEVINRNRHKMKIDMEELTRVYKERVQFHINNQIDILENKMSFI